MARWLLIYLLMGILLGLLGCQAVVPTQAPVGAADTSGATTSPEIMQLIADKEYMARNTQRVDAILRLAPGVEGNIASFFVAIDSALPPADLLTSVGVSLHRGAEVANVTLTPAQGSSHAFDNRAVSWQTESIGEGIALTVTIEAPASPPQPTEQWTVKLANLPIAGTSTTVGLTTGRVVGMEVDPLVYAQPATYSVTVSSPVTMTLNGFGRRTVYPSADDGCAGITLTWQAQAGAPQVTTTTDTVLEDGNPICKAEGTVSVAAITESRQYTYFVQGEVEGDFTNEAIATLNIEIPSIARVPLAAGTNHTCALTAVGGVLCWGGNITGQLGDGTTEDHYRPMDVKGLTSGVQAIAAGDSHTCALTTEGGVSCWGGNLYGELGDGTHDNQSTPVDVAGLSSGVRAIDAGSNHTCALTELGGIKCWGRNENGQLGDGSRTNRTSPVDVEGLTSGVRAIDAGSDHTCALMTTGSVKCWGWNKFAQLGDGTSGDDEHLSMIPVDVVGLPPDIEAIAVGDDHTCALTSAGGVKCWGNNEKGQMGIGIANLMRDMLAADPFRSTPVDVAGLQFGVRAIDAGGRYTCAITTMGVLFCWGYNVQGAIGNGDKEAHFSHSSVLTPSVVAVLPLDIEAIATGFTHACAMTTTRKVFCWGENGSGQLAYGKGGYRPIAGDVVLQMP